MRRSQVFYGWYIVAGGFTIAVLLNIFYFYGFGVFYLPLLAALKSSRAALGGVIGLSQLQGGLIAPVVGWLIDRYGPRRLMFIGMTIMGLGFIAMSRITTLWMLYVVFIAVAIGTSLGGVTPVTVTVANWFFRKRGRAMGLILAGAGLGGGLGWALAWLISTFGWRTMAVTAGLSFFVIGYPLVWLFRHRPEQMGLLPDGASSAPQEQPAQGVELEGERAPDHRRQDGQEEGLQENEITPRKALKTPAFWLLAIAFAGWSPVVTVVSVYQIPFFTEEMGAPFVTAAVVASLVPMISIPGRVGFGWLGDLVNARLLLAGMFFAQVIGLALLAQLPSLAWAPLYLIIFAPAYGGSMTLRNVVVAHFYGRRNFGTISGLLQFVDLPGGVLGPIFMWWVFDSLGSYRPGFLVLAVWMFISAGAILAARRPQAEPAPQAAVTR